jgi:hypothetical protein
MRRLEDLLRHPTVHAALTNVQPDQHHDPPSTLEVSNTTLVVQPLPGGPGQWDISVPETTQAAIFSLRSNRTIELSSGKSGITGIATRSSLAAATAGLGGHATISTTAYAHTYAKAGGALYLSAKIFDSAGANIALADCYLTLTGPSTRVLRTTWTNFSAGLRTLNVWGEIILLS